MQDISLVNKGHEQMKFQIENEPIEVKGNFLHHDFVTIILNSDKSKIPPFIKSFWEKQQKHISSSKTID